MDERGWAYRRRPPEGTVLYEAVRENLATLLSEASDVGRGLSRYVERDFARYPAQGPEDALQAYQAHSLRQRLRRTEVDVRLPSNKQPRRSLLEGFSLHANTYWHANERQGLERRCRYRARGALALERLPRAEDSRIAYWMKRRSRTVLRTTSSPGWSCCVA